MKSFPQIVIMNGKAATGVDALSPGLVENYDHIGLILAGSNTAAFTVKVQGSQSQTKPDFTAAQSPTNLWDYVQLKDLQNGSSIDGDTGVVFAADDVRQFEVNTNGMRWINPIVTAFTSGKAYAYLKGFATDEAS